MRQYPDIKPFKRMHFFLEKFFRKYAIASNTCILQRFQG